MSDINEPTISKGVPQHDIISPYLLTWTEEDGVALYLEPFVGSAAEVMSFVCLLDVFPQRDKR